MDESVYVEIEELGRMPVAQLRQRYREVFGEDTSTHHKQHLARRIAWRLQVLAQGDLSERARRRALEIAKDAKGVIGFAIGRTVFWPAILKLKENEINREDAVNQIAANFLSFYRIFTNK